MNVELKRIGVLRTGIILAIFYGVLALLFIPFMGIGILASIFEQGAVDAPPAAAGTAGMGIMLIVMLIMYPVMGFIGGIIMAALYNLIARFIGGMQLELQAEPVQSSYPMPNTNAGQGGVTQNGGIGM